MKKYIFLILMVSLLAFTFTGNPPSGGWYQQFLPDLGGRQIMDIEFTDSLTGFAVTDYLFPSNDTGYILKTTNGGDNWFYSLKINKWFTKIKFINENTGYAIGGGGSCSYLCKTTNAGINWIEINSPCTFGWDDISIVNEDSIWVTDGTGFFGGLFRTTNGGLNWTNQFYTTSLNPDKVYMINGRIGFMGALFKTTNSGLNWFQTVGEPMGLMYFKDTLNGYRAAGPNFKKTTNGGLNWTNYSLPTSAQFLSTGIVDFSFISDDTLWGVGGIYRFGPGNYRAMIWKSTNGGINWGYQIPDTSINIYRYSFIDFVTKTHGWAHSTVQGGVHTTIGGDDTTIYVGINQVNSEVPTEFKLHQNYPNPFNPTTSIKFKVRSLNLVRLSVYDISGKGVVVLVNEELQAGEYEYRFDGAGLSSGVYFYRLTAGEYVEAKRMMLIK